MNEVKIICTIGPGSNKPEILEKLKDRGVSFFRINLSHTEEENIENRIKEVLGYDVKIILDTEGAQVRSGNTEEIAFDEGNIVKLYFDRVKCDSQNMFLTPIGITKKLQEGDLISIDFNSLLLRVFDASSSQEGYISCKVVIGGLIGGKKAVQIDSPTFGLPAFSDKDLVAIDLAKKYGITHFTLSFMENPESVLEFKKNYPDATVYSKIESKKGLDNFIEIAKNSDGVLIDRGDLSSQVPLEKIPYIQKYVIKKVREMGKEAFVATNTLEQMAFSLKPSKAEVNDIVNTLIDGATGIALTKETAVGKYPVETVNMLSNLISQFNFLEKDVKKIEEKNYIYGENFPELLIKPHGGKLVNRFNPSYSEKIPESKLEIDEDSLINVEQIALGSFSPLEGFMTKSEVESVAKNMMLPNGVFWPLPITLQVRESEARSLKEGEDLALTYKNEVYAILHLKEIYSLEKDGYFLGGKVTLLKRTPSKNKVYELTPKQARKIFSEKGWSKVLGFHSRNLDKEFKVGLFDGLFIHPGIKENKEDEISDLIKSYEKMTDGPYSKSKAVFGILPIKNNGQSERDVLFSALVRKNFGCSHFLLENPIESKNLDLGISLVNF